MHSHHVDKRVQQYFTMYTLLQMYTLLTLQCQCSNHQRTITTNYIFYKKWTVKLLVLCHGISVTLYQHILNLISKFISQMYHVNCIAKYGFACTYQLHRGSGDNTISCKMAIPIQPVYCNDYFIIVYNYCTAIPCSTIYIKRIITISRKLCNTRIQFIGVKCFKRVLAYYRNRLKIKLSFHIFH